MAYIARLTFYADIAQVEALRERAYANGTTISGYVRNLVLADIRKHPQARSSTGVRTTPQAITQARAAEELPGQQAIDCGEPNGGGADA